MARSDATAASCSSLRGNTEDHFLDGVKITGAGPVYDLIKQGAATICL